MTVIRPTTLGFTELYEAIRTGRIPEGWVNTSWRNDQEGRVVPQITRYGPRLGDGTRPVFQILGTFEGELAYTVTLEEESRWGGTPVGEGVRPTLQGALDATMGRELMYTEPTQDVGSAATPAPPASQELGPGGKGSEISDGIEEQEETKV